MGPPAPSLSRRAAEARGMFFGAARPPEDLSVTTLPPRRSGVQTGEDNGFAGCWPKGLIWVFFFFFVWYNSFELR